MRYAIFQKRQTINPYEVQAAGGALQTKTEFGHSPFALAAWCLCYFYPLLAVGSVYLSWLVAWKLLGHPPQAMVDDPKGIGGAMHFAYFISMILMVPFPVLGTSGFVVALWCPILSIRRSALALTMLASAYLLMCALAFVLVQLDPGRVFTWWAD